MRDADDWAYSEALYGENGVYGGGRASAGPTPAEMVALAEKEAAEREADFRRRLAEAVAAGTVVTSEHRLRQRRYWEGRKGGWQDLPIPPDEVWTVWEGHAATTDPKGVVRVRVALPAASMSEARVEKFAVTPDGKWSVESDHSTVAKVRS